MSVRPPSVLIDGTPVGCVPVDDRGLAYGDGLFETMVATDGRVRFLDRHLDRLMRGCDRLGIPRPDRDSIESDIATLAGDDGECVIKLIVTRGSGGRGYRPRSSAPARRIVTRHPRPGYPASRVREGVSLRWCETRLAHQPSLAGVKHLNRLEQVLARAEWHEDDRWQEGLMCDSEGLVIEATQANLFIVRAGEMVTPVLDRCGIAGIIRGMLIERLGAVTDRVVPTDVETADEVFICNSVIGIWPVRSVADTVYVAPGPVTARAIEWLASVDD